MVTIVAIGNCECTGVLKLIINGGRIANEDTNEVTKVKFCFN